jgi:hypothetical protein
LCDIIGVRRLILRVIIILHVIIIILHVIIIVLCVRMRMLIGH